MRVLPPRTERLHHLFSKAFRFFLQIGVAFWEIRKYSLRMKGLFELQRLDWSVIATPDEFLWAWGAKSAL